MIVNVELRPDVYERLAREAAELGCSVPELIALRAEGGDSVDLQVTRVYADLLIRVGRLALGTTFTVKDLYTAIEWSALSTSTRLSVGRLFRKQIRDGLVTGISVSSKYGNAQGYKKEAAN